MVIKFLVVDIRKYQRWQIRNYNKLNNFITFRYEFNNKEKHLNGLTEYKSCVLEEP